MSAVERWIRRLTVGVLGAVTAVFIATASSSPGIEPPGVVGMVLLAVAELLCLTSAAAPLPVWRAAAATAAGVLLPLLGSLGHRADADGYSSGVWYVAGVLALTFLLLWGGRPACAWLLVAVLVAHTVAWGGVEALLSLSVLAMVILLAAITASRSAILRAESALDRAAALERESIDLRSVQDAYQQQRQARLAAAARTAGPMLQRIAEHDGRLEAADRMECRVLEQTVRDEIRGHRLMNGPVREQVLAHRRRGASVQVNDDGGIDDEAPDAIDELLDRVAEALAGLTSDRIVVRTLPADSPGAVSIVATTLDPVAAALGIDSDDDAVDLWLELPRPSRAAQTA